ncbi:hypothetical protein GCM10011575_38410 [Microlunatus endophyticus]|uniref:VanZ-like domain-containing protein n=1 Tax=Microlunatus endophyticus TaxID=1716077 RepID=A0A917SGW4_9ACTN|nr:VanZ family protein [Microlunatus endophyticus]GGL76585.1 hypothetical protein GCM10011575_38410 [Microlunatus endophyticus]
MYWDVRLLLETPGTLIALAVIAVIAVPIARLISRRTVRPWWLVGPAVAAVGGILGATLGPDGGIQMAKTACVQNLVDFDGDLAAVFSGGIADAWPNVILYVPAGFFVSLVTRRPVLTWLGLVALSACVEFVQPYISRACSSIDWMTNSAGAFLGVAGAAATLLARQLATRSKVRVLSE